MEVNNRFRNLYLKNLELTKQRIKDSINSDNFINQSVNNLDEIDKAANLLGKRLREWFSLKNPEFSKSVTDHKKFVELILNNKDKKHTTHMGADLTKNDMEPILNLAVQIQSLYILRQKHENYLDQIMKDKYPNIYAVSGALIGAKILAHTKTLKKLSMMTASTIQLLGAEKALFRHIKTGAKAPKHGLILQHQILQRSKPKFRGKIARQLSDKIAIAAKIDYFKGNYLGDKLRKELDDKVTFINKQNK
jgi:nucleolar protein 56